MNSLEVDGFRFAGLHCGLKKNGALDVGLIVADRPVRTAAVFTKNRVKAAPIEVAATRLASGWAQAFLVNSGNANACTGKAGLRACEQTTRAIARALRIKPELVIPASTGVIGELLPAKKIEAHAEELVRALRLDRASEFSKAIMTTDRWPKTSVREIAWDRSKKVKILGIAKGAGMIHPNMATTLGFVVTNAPVPLRALRETLGYAVDETLNRVSVDGDTSTNDVIFLATSESDSRTVSRAQRVRFQNALTEVLDELSQSMVQDGEGAEHVVRIQTLGARSTKDAHAVAHAIATSLLVKTALHGCDPNWGRILAAAGRSGAQVDPSKISLRIDGAIVVQKGVHAPQLSDAKLRERMKKSAYTIEIDLKQGASRGHYFTCDLGHEYVRINADYRS